MTTLNLSYATPPTLTGFGYTVAAKSIVLTWDASSASSDRYEVWQSSTNTSSSATKIATVETNSYSVGSLTSGTTYYFWVRILDGFGIVGAFQSSPTGLTVITPQLTSADVANSAVTTSSTSSGTGTASTTPTVYGTYYNGPYLEFTANSNDFVQAYLSMYGTISNVIQGGQVAGVSVNAGGSGYTNGTYTLFPTTECVSITYANVPLTGGSGIGAQASITLTSGVVTTVTITNTGNFYVAGNTLSCANTSIGGATAGTGFVLTVNTVSSGTIATKTLTNGGSGYGPKSNCPINVTVSGGAVTAVSIRGGAEGGDGWTSGATFTTNNFGIGGTGSGFVGNVTSVTSAGTLRVSVRTRLYDLTGTTDVPAGIKYRAIYLNNAGSAYGQTNFIADENPQVLTGFRGLLTPGRTYRLYLEIAKIRDSGTPSCDISFGASASASSFATMS